MPPLENLSNQTEDKLSPPADKDGAVFEVAARRCRSWYDPKCLKAKGYRLREQVVNRVQAFQGVAMVTLTVDPDLFESPFEALMYIRKNRCISRLARELNRLGHLYTMDYFYGLEFQEAKTGMPHYHVLFNTGFIPHDEIKRVWGLFRPQDAGPILDKRPPFGCVWISIPSKSRKGISLKDAKKAANYATKYLCKPPKDGYPDWLLDLGAEIRVLPYSHSRGFFTGDSDPDKRTQEKVTKDPEDRLQRKFKSYRDREKECGQSLDMFEHDSKVDRSSGEVVTTHQWRRSFDGPARPVLEQIEDHESPERSRRTLQAADYPEACQIVTNAQKKAHEQAICAAITEDKKAS